MSVDAHIQGTVFRVTPVERDVPSTHGLVVEIDDEGTKRWMVGGVLHREDGPAVEYANGLRMWFCHGEQHREHGPAAEYPDGSTEWFRHGQPHREEGPANEYAGGGREWYRHGQLHRENGPAIEWPSGKKKWYLNGKELAKPEWFCELLKNRPLTTRQRELLHALSENWAGTPELLYETVTHLAG